MQAANGLQRRREKNCGLSDGCLRQKVTGSQKKASSKNDKISPFPPKRGLTGRILRTARERENLVVSHLATVGSLPWRDTQDSLCWPLVCPSDPARHYGGLHLTGTGQEKKTHTRFSTLEPVRFAEPFGPLIYTFPWMSSRPHTRSSLAPFTSSVSMRPYSTKVGDHSSSPPVNIAVYISLLQ